MSDVSIEKTPAGTWKARWREHGRDKAKTFRRKGDAEAFERARRTDLARGTYAPAKVQPATVAEMADLWLDNATNLRPSTIATYRRDLDRHILPTLGHLRLEALTPDDVARLLARQKADGTASSSLLRHYTTINRLCVVAIRAGRLRANPCDLVDRPKVEDREYRYLTAKQVDALAAAMPPRYQAWVQVAAWGGLRWSELVGLRRGRVDGAKLTVVEQMLREAGEWVRVPPKSASSRRTLTLPEHAAEALERHLGEWSQEGRDGLVFPNRLGQPLGSSTFRSRAFQPALTAAGLDPRTRVHDLRHTAVALAIAAGAHPKAIQARMGHASIQVTLDRYGHLFPSADAELAAALTRSRAD